MVESAISTNYTLNNGMKIPVLGLGTYPILNPAVFEQAIVKAGYRHLDTASFYHNEEEVGQGIEKAISSGIVKREDLFIVTKIWHTEFSNPEQALRRSLSKLKFNYVDCYLIHWPNNLLSE